MPSTLEQSFHNKRVMTTDAREVLVDVINEITRRIDRVQDCFGDEKLHKAVAEELNAVADFVRNFLLHKSFVSRDALDDLDEWCQKWRQTRVSAYSVSTIDEVREQIRKLRTNLVVSTDSNALAAILLEKGLTPWNDGNLHKAAVKYIEIMSKELNTMKLAHQNACEIADVLRKKLLAKNKKLKKKNQN